MSSEISLWWVFGFYFAERGVEVSVSERHRRKLLSRGGMEFAPESYRPMVLMHAAFFVFLLIEAHPWRIPLNASTLACLGGLVLLQALRYWCIVTLGEFWNTRIVVLPGAKAVKSGPYRFMRHPNYLVVVLEFVLLPLLMRAPVTLVLFSALNVAVLRRRIRLEEEALRECTDY